MSVRYELMDTPKPVSEMSDIELVREWNCIDCDNDAETPRTKELAAEMEKRDIDF